jgi:hypothetical protein
MENAMVCRPEVTGRRLAAGASDAGEPDAYTIRQFCAKHGLSIAFYYKLKARGLTPAEIHLGARRLISRESAAAWRRAREAATATGENPA